MATHRFTSSLRFDKPDGWVERQGVTDDGAPWSSKSRKYKPVIADVELLIDAEELMRRLGAKALKSKSGRSAALYGLVKVKVLREREGG